MPAVGKLAQISVQTGSLLLVVPKNKNRILKNKTKKTSIKKN
jgi:hypothetical protein